MRGLVFRSEDMNEKDLIKSMGFTTEEPSLIQHVEENKDVTEPPEYWLRRIHNEINWKHVRE